MCFVHIRAAVLSVIEKCVFRQHRHQPKPASTFSFCPYMTVPLYLYMTVPLYLHKVMESLGVLQELREEGAANGDLVLVGEKQIALAEPPENLG